LGSRNNQNNRRGVEDFIFDLPGNTHATGRHRFTVKNDNTDAPTINSAVKGTHKSRCRCKLDALDPPNIHRGLVTKC
jgi:hypothetical protein